jgi:hypothetical protein
MRFTTTLLILLAVVTSSIACNPFSKRSGNLHDDVERQYNDWISENGEYIPGDPDISNWPHSYHPILHFAWVHKGGERKDRELGNRLREMNDIYWALDDDLKKQVSEGKTSFDRERFLAIIDDEHLRARTSELIAEGVTAIYAFARAGVESVQTGRNNIPEEILRQLGSLYESRSDLLEVPVGEPVTDDDSQWRDWLHTALAATGGSGAKAILDWNSEIESLQDLAPDQPFRQSALDMIFSELGQYRDGGGVSDFHKWMYWNLARTTWDSGGMYPYTDDDVNLIVDFLMSGGLENGLTGEGEEAWVIADALGRAPSWQWAVALFQEAENNVTEQVRRDLCFSAIAQMLHMPVNAWLTTTDSALLLKGKALSHIEDRRLLSNEALLKLYSGILTAFSADQASFLDCELTDDELFRIHDAFIILLPELTIADDRAAALDLLRWGLMQPEFTLWHEGASRYYDPLTEIFYDWILTTTFENSETTSEQFAILLLNLRLILNIDIPWQPYLDPDE